MSKSGNGTDDEKGGPPAGDEAGMAVIRVKRRASLEKALRGGAAPSPASEKPNAAASWGNVLQREARGGDRSVPPEPTPEPARPVVSARRESVEGDPRVPPASRPADRGVGPNRPATGSMPRLPADAAPSQSSQSGRPATGSMPRLPADAVPSQSGRPATGSMARIPAQPSAEPAPGAVERVRRPAIELEATPLRSNRAPSVAGPDDLDNANPSLAEQANQLAVAHDEHQRKSTFGGLQFGIKSRLAGSVLITAVGVVLAVYPALITTERLAGSRALAEQLAQLAHKLESDGRLAPALMSHDLMALRGIFGELRGEAAAQLKRAGFPADETSLRLRLTDAGAQVALSVEFPGDDDDVEAATQITGHPVKLPEAPSLFTTIVEETMMTSLAWMTLALMAVGTLWVLPWRRARRAAG